MLAVYAHPDDPEVSCGGTIASWVAGGAEVHLVLVNQGDKGSSDPAVQPSELARRRATEVEASAQVLGLSSITMFGEPDGESENTLALRGRLVDVLRRVKPDVVVCPDPTALFFGDSYVNHRDHRVAGFLTLDAVAPAAASPLYFAGRGAPHRVATMYLSGTLEPDTFVDIGATIDVKAAALACHTSQLGEGGEWVRELVQERAVEAGRRTGVRYAEAFRVLRLA